MLATSFGDSTVVLATTGATFETVEVIGLMRVPLTRSVRAFKDGGPAAVAVVLVTTDVILATSFDVVLAGVVAVEAGGVAAGGVTAGGVTAATGGFTTGARTVCTTPLRRFNSGDDETAGAAEK